MTIEAPLSKHRKNTLIIYMALCIGFALWCAYDGYYNDEWIAEHTDADGNPQTYLVFNRNAPYYLVGASVLFGLYLFKIKDDKIIADENELVINGKEKITYDSIEKIDRTHFKSKGHFTITYKQENGREAGCKLDDRTYDNLESVLDKLIAKIS